MTTSDILQHRLSNEHLTNPKQSTPQEMVGLLGAVQSQDYTNAKWAVGQRLIGATEETLEQALIDGSILRTHVMRPTWHFVTPRDIRWMLELTAPQIKTVMGSYNRKLELDEKIFNRSNTLITKALQGNQQLIRQEIKDILTKAGIVTDVQRLAHLVMNAELDGLICSGPKRAKQFTYMLLEERVPKTKSLEHDEALQELTKRYFFSHGPAQVQDFAWWSGLRMTDAKKGIELLKAELISKTIEGKSYWFSPSNPLPITDTAYLLPNYDEYTISYKDRDAFMPIHPVVQSTNARENIPFNHTIIFKGRIIGMWKPTVKTDSIIISSRFFDKPTPTEHNAFQKAAGSYGKFFGKAISLTDK